MERLGNMPNWFAILARLVLGMLVCQVYYYASINCCVLEYVHNNSNNMHYTNNYNNNRILNVQTPMYVEVPTSFAILFRVVFQTYTNKATRGDETSIISY